MEIEPKLCWSARAKNSHSHRPQTSPHHRSRFALTSWLIDRRMSKHTIRDRRYSLIFLLNNSASSFDEPPQDVEAELRSYTHDASSPVAPASPTFPLFSSSLSHHTSASPSPLSSPTTTVPRQSSQDDCAQYQRSSDHQPRDLDGQHLTGQMRSLREELAPSLFFVQPYPKVVSPGDNFERIVDTRTAAGSITPCLWRQQLASRFYHKKRREEHSHHHHPSIGRRGDDSAGLASASTSSSRRCSLSSASLPGQSSFLYCKKKITRKQSKKRRPPLPRTVFYNCSIFEGGRQLMFTRENAGPLGSASKG